MAEESVKVLSVFASPSILVMTVVSELVKMTATMLAGVTMESVSASRE